MCDVLLLRSISFYKVYNREFAFWFYGSTIELRRPPLSLASSSSASLGVRQRWSKNTNSSRSPNRSPITHSSPEEEAPAMAFPLAFVPSALPPPTLLLLPSPLLLLPVALSLPPLADASPPLAPLLPLSFVLLLPFFFKAPSLSITRRAALVPDGSSVARCAFNAECASATATRVRMDKPASRVASASGHDEGACVLTLAAPTVETLPPLLLLLLLPGEEEEVEAAPCWAADNRILRASWLEPIAITESVDPLKYTNLVPCASAHIGHTRSRRISIENIRTSRRRKSARQTLRCTKV